MPILVSDINKRVLADLDAEGSERYLFDQDVKPALNSAIEILVTMCNQAFAQNKLTPESLRELLKVRVWKASKYSRINFNEIDAGHPLWTIAAVYPKIKADKGIAGAPIANDSESKLLKGVAFLESEQSAKRLTLEEWNQNTKNVFMPGNTILQGELSEYAYLDFADYSTDSKYTSKIEIQVRPAVPGELVAIAYLKQPTPVAAIGDFIEFPQSLTELISELVLMKISMKQGDQTNLSGFASQNINRLASLIL